MSCDLLSLSVCQAVSRERTAHLFWIMHSFLQISACVLPLCQSGDVDWEVETRWYRDRSKSKANHFRSASKTVREKWEQLGNEVVYYGIINIDKRREEKNQLQHWHFSRFSMTCFIIIYAPLCVVFSFSLSRLLLSRSRSASFSDLGSLSCCYEIPIIIMISIFVFNEKDRNTTARRNLQWRGKMSFAHKQRFFSLAVKGLVLCCRSEYIRQANESEWRIKLSCFY